MYVFIIQISVEISNEKILTHFIYLIGLLDTRLFFNIYVLKMRDKKCYYQES